MWEVAQLGVMDYGVVGLHRSSGFGAVEAIGYKLDDFIGFHDVWFLVISVCKSTYNFRYSQTIGIK